MPLIKAVLRMSRRSFLPRILAWAGPENGANAASATSTVSWRDPPSVQPTQFSSVRAASLRTDEGRSADLADTMYRASLRVTSLAASDCVGFCGTRGDKLSPPDAKR